MPTGYTAAIYEGKEVSRNDFILGCARAFGALIEMRDAPSGTPIPEDFQPNSYHKGEIEKAKQAIFLANAYTLKDAQSMLEEEYKAKIERNKIFIEERKTLYKRLNEMKKEVQDWLAPSEEHQALKDFCIEQLESTIKHDCDYSYYTELPEKESAELWIINKKEQAEKDLHYHEKEWKEELKRISKRNHWVKLLKNSLV